MKKYLLALSIISLFNSSSCTKNTPAQEQLPPETHTGAYTFGCKVDGKIYTANGKGGLLATQHVNYGYFADSSIDVSVGNTDSKFNFHCTIKYLGSLGI